MASCESGRRTLGPFIRICPVHHRGQAPDQVEIRRRPGDRRGRVRRSPSAFSVPHFPNGVAHAMRPPLEPLFLGAFHAAVALRPSQQAQECLGLRPLERDHVAAMVRRPGLPVLDHPEDAVPGLLLHRHELGHLRRGPRILEGPREHGETPVRDDRDLVRHLVQEGAVVAHDEQHARIRPQGRRHDLLALDVEVVRRLVEDEQVVVLGDELREGEARALPAAELADAAVDGVPSEPEAAEEAPRPVLGRRRIPHAADLLEEGALEVELLRLLREVADLQVLAPEDGSRVRVLATDQDLEEGRLPRAVRTDEADLVPLRQLEINVGEEEAAAVGLRDALEAHDPRTRGARAEGAAEGARRGRRRLRRLAPHLFDPELAGEHLLVHLAGLELLDDRELPLEFRLMPVALGLSRPRDRVALHPVVRVIADVLEGAEAVDLDDLSAIASRRNLSWLARRTAASISPRNASIVSIVSTSMWFVGSSSRRTSFSFAFARARAVRTLDFSPPEREPNRWSRSSSPTPRSLRIGSLTITLWLRAAPRATWRDS